MAKKNFKLSKNTFQKSELISLNFLFRIFGEDITSTKAFENDSQYIKLKKSNHFQISKIK